MKLNQLNIEQLVELRTKMILEKRSTDLINRIIDEKEREYVSLLLEDKSEYERVFEDTSSTGGTGGSVTGGSVGSIGVAFANNTIGGMGPVVSAQPSSLSGTTIGSNWSDNGGTTGSGDISNPMNLGSGKNVYQKTPVKEMGKQHGPRTGKKSRVKKLDLKALKSAFSKKQDYTGGSESPRIKKVMNFNDFQKDGLDKVTKVKQ